MSWKTNIFTGYDEYTNDNFVVIVANGSNNVAIHSIEESGAEAPYGILRDGDWYFCDEDYTPTRKMTLLGPGFQNILDTWEMFNKSRELEPDTYELHGSNMGERLNQRCKDYVAEAVLDQVNEMNQLKAKHEADLKKVRTWFTRITQNAPFLMPLDWEVGEILGVNLRDIRKEKFEVCPVCGKAHNDN